MICDKKYLTTAMTCIMLPFIICQRLERGFSSPESEIRSPDQKPLNKHIPILYMELDNNGEGAYRYAYETGNQITQQEVGDGRKSQGSYTYTAPDGQHVSMSYIADTNGFQAQGSHIPIPPPMPDAIQKAIEQNLADEARGIFDDGQYRVQYNTEESEAPKAQQYRKV